jgi:hypothetical protein
MKTRIILVAALSAFLATFFGGCAWQVGGDTKHAVQCPTTGQQLLDLKKARDHGVITDQEYEAQKQKLLAK